MDLDTKTIEKLLENKFDNLSQNIYGFYFFTNGLFLFLAHAGLLCVVMGSAHTKNMGHVMIKCFLSPFICMAAFYLTGFPLACGDGSIFGTSKWTSSMTSEDFIVFFYNFAAAANISALITSTIAERSQFFTYVIINAIYSGFTYPVAAHWVSTNGFIKTLGYKDIKGSGLLHIFSGTSVFTASVILGPRKERKFDTNHRLGHSKELIGIGCFLRICGSIMFTGGLSSEFVSLIHTNLHELIGQTITNSLLGGFGAIVVISILSRYMLDQKLFLYEYIKYGASCGIFSVSATGVLLLSWEAIISGAVASLIFLALCTTNRFYKIDDPLDIIPVSFGAGFVGILMFPFVAENGLVKGSDWSSKMEGLEAFGASLFAACIIMVWAIFSAMLLFGILKYAKFLRLPSDVEEEGFDKVYHRSLPFPPETWEWGSIKRF